MLARIYHVAGLLLLAFMQRPAASSRVGTIDQHDSVTPVPGGFTPVPVEQADTDRLTKVLQSSASYATGSPLRLCFVDVLGLSAQVVAGINYDYDILACAVSVAENGQGKCASACAEPARYQVRVFEQEWTDTLVIESILELVPSPHPVPLPLPIPDPPIPDPLPEPPVPGGFTPVPVEQADTDRLTKVLQSSASYATGSPLRLCFVDVLGLSAQVVAGINYDYDILACAVSVAENGQGKCASACAEPARYQVRVFEQEWTDTLVIESILELVPSPHPVPLPLPIPDPPIPDPLPEPPVPGGFTPVPVEQADTDRLTKVLQSSASYATGSPLRLCFVDVLGLSAQVVAGINYDYDILACAVSVAENGQGKCASACAEPARYQVRVFEQEWTDTLVIESILELVPSPHPVPLPLPIPDPPIPDPLPEPPVPGGFTPVPVEQADTDRLTKVLQSSASYATGSPLRLCFVDVLGLSAQVVAGINYDYDILACAVSVAENGQGKCASACAEPARYQVRVFEQEWTDTLVIESILELVPSPHPVPLPLPIPDPPIPDPLPEPPVPGGFTPVPVEQADTDRLTKVLQSSASYATGSPLRLCFVDVLGLSAQVVAGINYDYDILACAVSVAENGQGKCASACAEPARYQVRVFEQEWTDTLVIESILELVPSPHPVPLPLPIPDPPIPDPLPEPPVPGGFTPVPVEQADTDRLTKVLQSSASYATGSPLRLCFVDVLGLSAQVVAGINYDYDILACAVSVAENGQGKCASACAEPARYQVRVFEQEWTDTLVIESILELVPSPHPVPLPLPIPDPPIPDPLPEPPVPGGFTPVPVEQADTDRLTKVLQSSASYATGSPLRLCFVDVLGLSAQVVAGINYDYDILACAVSVAENGQGKCASACAEPARYQVRVFEQEWTDTLVIESILELVPSPHPVPLPLPIPDPPIPDPLPEPPVPGGFTPVPVEQADTDRLTKVLQSSASYATGSPLRLCFVDVLGLSAQVVAGINYDYDILACAVSVAENGQGKCASACAEPARYQVRVFEQEWTDTLVIESILELVPSPHPVPLPLPIPDPPIPDPLPEPPVPGGFTPVPVEQADTDRLTKVLQSSASYATGSPLRLCFVDVLGLSAQVVAGINYDYDILACAVSVAENGQGKCASACAEPARYQVRVFEQEWTDTLVIESILELVPSPHPVPLPLPIPDPPIPDPLPEPPVPGGFTPVPVEQADTDRLTKVLQSSASYATGSPLRLCFVDVLGLSAQVVAGINYDYDILACAVSVAENGQGKCASACAEPARYQVRVFEQEWTDTLVIESILELVPSPHPVPLPLPIPDPPIPDPLPEPPVPGGFTPVPVEQADTDRLTKVLQSSASYATDSPLRLCYVDVLGIDMNVSGSMSPSTHKVVVSFVYDYELVGCIVSTAEAGGGVCAANCERRHLGVTVVEQPSSGLLQVRLIEG